MANARFRRYRRGDRDSAADKNALRAEVERLSRFGSGIPGITNGSGVFPGPSPDDGYYRVRNDSEEDIPAFGVMRVTGVIGVSGRQVTLTVDRPNTYGSQYSHLINGTQIISAGGYGDIRDDKFMFALYDTADGTPANGTLFGTRSGSWKIRPNTGGWMVMGNAQTEVDHCVIVTRVPFLRFRGVTNAAIAAGATGSVSVFPDGGDDTLVDFDCLNEFGDIAISKTVECVWRGDLAGTSWKIVAAQC